MRLGIMQPYFFPYLGHFALIAACDRWVVFDVTQYTPRSWISRNRVLHPQQGWNYISVPLANGSISIRIADARIADFAATRASVLGKLTHYRRQAPHYASVTALVEDVFAEPQTDLVELNMRSLARVCSHLGLPWSPVRASRLELDLPPIRHAGQWAPQIGHALGARTYVNPLGGAGIFRREDFEAAGVDLAFLDFQPPAYATGRYAFEANLSILDVLMWNEPGAVWTMLQRHTRRIPGAEVLH